MNQPLFEITGPLCFGTAQRKTMEDIKTPDYPGPGTHQQVKLYEINPPTWKFGNDQDRSSFLCLSTRHNPAPDNYQVNSTQTQYKFPQYSIGKAKNIQQKINQNSRYNYDPNPEVVKVRYPHYTLGYAEEIKYDTDVPPPNNYFKESTESKQMNIKQNHFTKAPRPNPYGQQAKFPGVGQYQVSPQRQKKEGYTIGKSQRPDPSHGKNPPKYYNIGNNMAQIGTSKTQGKYFPIYQHKEKYGFPSSTYYTVKRPKSGRNVITFSSQRSKMHNTMTVKNPSADKYAHPLNISKYTMSKSQSFAKSKRPILKVQESPSPNEYDLDNPEFRFNHTHGKMGGKIKQLSRFITPAGANYAPQENLTRPQPQRVINYYSHRTDFSKSSTGKKVGPGSYVNPAQWNETQKGKMDRSAKLLLKDNKQPGPGYYNITGTIGVLPRYYRLPRKIFADGTLNENSIQKDPTIQKHNETMKKFQNSLSKFSNIKKGSLKIEKQNLTSN